MFTERTLVVINLISNKYNTICFVVKFLGPSARIRTETRTIKNFAPRNRNYVHSPDRVKP